MAMHDEGMDEGMMEQAPMMEQSSPEGGSELNAMRKHMIKHNIMGIAGAGIALSEAIDMALDLNEPLFSQRLKMRKKTVVGSPGKGGAGGGTIGPGGEQGVGAGG